ncbi:MAG: right-handed parallel beta-helix repeat-containing protein [Chitinophagaceae bacterium]|nr:right-handed parallel beta-helix repeat-containing protein [Chitinophagaceae bacterium]
MKPTFDQTFLKCIKTAGLLAAGAFIFSGCSKSSSSASSGVVLPANAITTTTISGGNIKGVMLTDSTYTVNGTLTVLPTDTLIIQPGAKINLTGDYAFLIQGTIASLGTQAKPITFNSTVAQQPGQWGGFQCDSAKSVTFYWTKVLWAGGPDAGGQPTQTIAVKSPIPVDIEDCWFVGGQDNAIGVFSTSNVKILRNSLYGNGTGDGDAIDFHAGVTGVVAYNVLWGGAGSAIKVYTSNTVQNPQTNVAVYNNTCVDNGFRRGSGEPGRGILVDEFSQARVYNNLLVNNYWELDITTNSDYQHTTYNNNYFYVTVDSLRQRMYPAGEIGTPQSNDIIDLNTTGANDPKFVGYTPPPDPTVRIIPTSFDFHLQSGSKALGMGYTGPALNLPAGVPGASSDIGAYVTDTTGGKGNRHDKGY